MFVVAEDEFAKAFVEGRADEEVANGVFVVTVAERGEPKGWTADEDDDGVIDPFIPILLLLLIHEADEVGFLGGSMAPLIDEDPNPKRPLPARFAKGEDVGGAWIDPDPVDVVSPGTAFTPSPENDFFTGVMSPTHVLEEQ